MKLESSNKSFRNMKVPAWCIPSDNTSHTFIATICGNESIHDAIKYAQHQLQVSQFIRLVSINRRACHIQFSANNLEAWKLFQHLLINLKNVDIAIQPLAWQAKKLLICDMDKTIVDAETLDEVAELVGIGDQVAKITEQAMRGEIDFHGALRERITLLKGQPQQVFLDVLAHCPINKGADNLIAKANANGLKTILISGGFADVAEPIAKHLGFDAVYCNQLEINKAKLTGNVIEPIVDADYKRSTLQRYMQENKFSTNDCCALGDGANDIPMLQTAGLGIAFQGKPLTREATPYQINVTDLETVGYFMGLE